MYTVVRVVLFALASQSLATGSSLVYVDRSRRSSIVGISANDEQQRFYVCFATTKTQRSTIVK